MSREPYQYPGEDGPLWQSLLLWVAWGAFLCGLVWLMGAIDSAL